MKNKKGIFVNIIKENSIMNICPKWKHWVGIRIAVFYCLNIKIRNMLSIEDCKKILNKGKRKYTNKEIKQIREYLEITVKEPPIRQSKLTPWKVFV